MNEFRSKTARVLLSLLLSAMMLGAVAERGAKAQNATSLSNGSPYTDLSAYLLVGKQAVPTAAIAGQAASTPNGNVVTIDQVGAGNHVAVDQQGFSNSSTAIQLGNGNYSTLTSTGTSNTLTSLQVGNSDSVSISAQGNGNTYSNTQIGSNLSYSVQQVGNGKNVSVVQVQQK